MATIDLNKHQAIQETIQQIEHTSKAVATIDDLYRKRIVLRYLNSAVAALRLDLEGK